MSTSSLGALTVDIIAKTNSFEAGMSKAERASANFERRVRRDIRAASKAVAGLATGTAAAVAAMTAAYVDNANEISRFSRIANTNIGDFQKMAIAAKTVGIEEDKLSDILKDVNDKMGDYMQTGGGALKDFFEEIAPKIGVTADAFRNLSGKDALQLYVDTLEKAGVNQQEMIYHMENLASDATNLLPILKDGGELIDEWGKVAEKAGVIMDENTAQAAKELGIQMNDAKMVARGLTNQFMTALLPTVNEAGLAFFQMEEGQNAATKAGKLLGKGLVWLLKIAKGVAAGFEVVGKAIASVMGYAEGLGNLSNNIGDTVNSIITQQVGQGMSTIEWIASGFNDNVWEKYEKANEAANDAVSASFNKTITGVKEDAQKANDVLKEAFADIDKTLLEAAEGINELDAVAEGTGEISNAHAESVRRRAEAEEALEKLKQGVAEGKKLAVDGETAKTKATNKTTKAIKAQTASLNQQARIAKAFSKAGSLGGNRGKLFSDKAFMSELLRFSTEKGIDYNDILRMFKYESAGFKKGVVNSLGYKGLFQIGRAAFNDRSLGAKLKGAGFQYKNFQHESALRQLKAYEIYYEHWNKIAQNQGKGNVRDLGGLLALQLAPGRVNQSYMYKQGQAGYRSNSPLDINNDGLIKQNEYAIKAVRNYTQSDKRLADEIMRALSGGEELGEYFKRVKENDNEAIAAAQNQLREKEREAKRAAQELAQKVEHTKDAFASLTGSLQTEEEKRLATLKNQLAVIKEMQALKDAGGSDVAQSTIDEARKRVIAGAVNMDDAPNYAVNAADMGVFGEYYQVQQQRAELQNWYSEKLAMQQQMQDEGLISAQEHAAAMVEIERHMQEQKQNLQYASEMAMMSAGQQTFANLASYARTYAGESSNIYRAMFAVEKAFAIARAAVAIQQGIAQAAANPWPTNLAAMASVASATGSIVSTLMGIQAPSGMAHDGIDKVPQDGTWLLQKGERVTTAQTSAKLDRTLSQVQQQQAQQTQNAPATNPQNIRIINSVDPQAMASYLGSGDGERIIMNVIRNNPAVIRKTIGG